MGERHQGVPQELTLLEERIKKLIWYQLDIKYRYRVNGTNIVKRHPFLMAALQHIFRSRSGEAKIFLLMNSVGRTKGYHWFPDKDIASYAQKRSLESWSARARRVVQQLRVLVSKTSSVAQFLVNVVANAKITVLIQAYLMTLCCTLRSQSRKTTNKLLFLFLFGNWMH